MRVIIRESAYADIERIHNPYRRQCSRVCRRERDCSHHGGNRAPGGFSAHGPYRPRAGHLERVVRNLPYIIVYDDPVANILTVLAVFHGATAVIEKHRFANSDAP